MIKYLEVEINLKEKIFSSFLTLCSFDLMSEIRTYP